jgi:predicted aspartyl protease
MRFLECLVTGLFAALVFCLGCAAPARSTAPRDLARIEVETHPFGPPGAVDAPHSTIEIDVAGAKRTVLLDSGGGVTVLSPAVAAALHCTPHGRLSAHRMSGERLDMPVCENVDLAIGGQHLHVPVAGVFDLGALVPQGWPHIDGLVSLQTFQDSPVTIDLASHTLVLESEQSLSMRVSKATPLEVRLARPAAGVALDVFVAAHKVAGGEKLWLILDTGSDGSLILAPHAAKLLGAEGSDGAKTSIEIEVSGLGVLALPANVRDVIYDGNIGVPALKAYALTFDLARGQAWATRITR